MATSPTFDLDTLVSRAASAQGVDPALVHSVIQTESSGNPAAVSPVGAVGLMQLMPTTAKSLGVDPTDPTQNVMGGTLLLRQLLDRYNGDTAKALAAYNAGPNGDWNNPETQAYVQKVMAGVQPQYNLAGLPPLKQQAPASSAGAPASQYNLTGLPPLAPSEHSAPQSSEGYNLSGLPSLNGVLGDVMAGAKAAYSMVPQPVKTTVGKVFDYLGRPGAATAGAVLAAEQGQNPLSNIAANLTGARRDNFDEVLGQAGMAPGLKRQALGLAADLVLDPTNLLGVGEVRDALKAGADATQIPALLSKVADVAKEQPLVQELGTKFIPRFGTPEDYSQFRQAFNSRYTAIPQDVKDAIVATYKGTTPEVRQAITTAIESGGSIDPIIDKFSLAQHQAFDQMFQKLVDAKVVSPDQYLTDYVPYVYEKKMGLLRQGRPTTPLNATTPFARQRQGESIEEAIAKGAQPDIAQIALNYNTKGEQAIATSNFLQDAADKWGIQLDPNNPLPAGYRQLNAVRASPMLQEHLDQFAFPNAIANDLDQLVGPRGTPGPLLQLYDQATRGFRTAATVMKPGFHVRNLRDDAFRTWQGGVNSPLPWLQSLQYGLEGTKLGDILGVKAPEVAGMAPDVLNTTMRNLGVSGTGHNFTTELGDQLANELQDNLNPGGIDLNPFNWAKKYVQLGHQAGSATADFAKRAMFFDQLHKGTAPLEAAAATKNALFDYGDLTPFEQNVMRRIVPFYSWMRKNTPFQVEQLAQNPQKFAALAKTSGDIENATQQAGISAPGAARPTYLQDQNAVQLPFRDPQGNDQFWAPQLPVEDLNMVPTPGGSSPTHAALQVLGALNPMLKAGVELPLDISTYFDEPLYNKNVGMTQDLQKAPALIQMLPPSVATKLPFVHNVQTAGGKTQLDVPFLLKYLMDQLPIVNTAGKAGEAVVGPNGTSVPGGLNDFLLGLKLTPQSRQQEQQNMQDALATLRNAMKKDHRQQDVPVQAPLVLPPFKP